MATVKQHLLPPASFLDTHRQDELDNLFDSLDCKPADELEGVYQGRLIGITGLSILPGIVKRVLYRVLGSWLNPWRGKEFTSSVGANQWGLGSCTMGWGNYQKIESDEATHIALDYDVPENPGFLRPIIGEVKSFQDGVWLARMRYRTRSGVKTLLYFTLREVK